MSPQMHSDAEPVVNKRNLVKPRSQHPLILVLLLSGNLGCTWDEPLPFRSRLIHVMLRKFVYTAATYCMKANWATGPCAVLAQPMHVQAMNRTHEQARVQGCCCKHTVAAVQQTHGTPSIHTPHRSNSGPHCLQLPTIQQPGKHEHGTAAGALSATCTQSHTHCP
jgi:hypothetical protein